MQFNLMKKRAVIREECFIMSKKTQKKHNYHNNKEQSIDNILDKCSGCGGLNENNELKKAAQSAQSAHGTKTDDGIIIINMGEPSDEYCANGWENDLKDEGMSIAAIAEAYKPVERYDNGDTEDGAIIVDLGEPSDEDYIDGWENDFKDEGKTVLSLLEEFAPVDGEAAVLPEVIETEATLTENNPENPVGDSGTKGKKKARSGIPYNFAVELLTNYEIRYIDSPIESNGLYFFNGRYWEALAKATLEYMVYNMITIQRRQEEPKIKAMCKEIMDFVYLECLERYYTGCFTDADFDSIKNHVVLNNGIYDAQSGVFYRDAFNSNLPYLSAIDADFIEGSDYLSTPAYDALKYNATDGDPDTMEMIDWMLGYLALPNLTGKVFFCLANAPNSGKTLLGNFFTSLLPADKVKTIEPEKLSNQFAMAGIQTKCLLTCLEMSTGNFNEDAVSIIKRVTGEKFIRSEAKFKGEKNAIVRAKILLATNGKIVIPDKSDEAFYKRLRVIPFLNSVPNDQLDANLLDKLRAERSAIITKCLLKLSNIIDPSGKIVFPESRLSAEMKESWRGEPRFETVFFDQMLEFTASESDFVFKKDLSDRYKEFLADNDLMTNTVLSQNELVNRCKSYFPGIKTAKKRRPDTGGNPIACFVGLRWR